MSDSDDFSDNEKLSGRFKRSTRRCIAATAPAAATLRPAARAPVVAQRRAKPQPSQQPRAGLPPTPRTPTSQSPVSAFPELIGIEQGEPEHAGLAVRTTGQVQPCRNEDHQGASNGSNRGGSNATALPTANTA
eukprot:3998140-Pleurochrysis_carterae.AAC.1